MGLHPAGWSPLGPQHFLERSNTVPVIDVRSPEEYRQGHIPGAISMPLFDDDERAVVGITYTHEGKKEALLKGLEITGPKLKDFVKKGHVTASGGELLVHCWRGGMRSDAMAWLLDYSGIKTSVLTGGYKAYRHYIRESFSLGPPLVVLGGMTGSGKTDILKCLSSVGEQVLDLEGRARHKGSAFGSLGQENQPTNEQFENDLARDWLAFDPHRPVWIEDESRNIGKVIIPEPLFRKMTAAPLVLVDIPFDQRVRRLAEEYGSFEQGELSAFIRKISPRMGGDKANAAISALEKGNLTGAVSEVLAYYDKAYQYGLSRYEGREILNIKTENRRLQSISKQVINLIQNSKYKI